MNRVIETDIPLEINNITITHGKADNCGGIFANNSLIINNSVISNNEATIENGGGICVKNFAVSNNSLIINNSSINNNKAKQSGGGIHVETNINVLIKNSSSINNNETINGSGGGIFATGISFNNVHTNNFQLIDSIIRNNNAYYDGGGLATAGEMNVLIQNSKIHNNSTQWKGGGIKIVNNTNNVTYINKSIINNNTSKFDGGGADISSGKVDIIDSIITQNESTMDAGGGLEINSLKTFINNNEISHNTAVRGGGMFVNVYPGNYDTNKTTITNNTFKFNSATDGGDINTYVNLFLADNNYSNSRTTIYNKTDLATAKWVVINNGGANASVTPIPSIPLDASFNIKKGWNLISSPINKKWIQTSILNDAGINVIWGFLNNAYYAPKSIDSANGYWAYNYNNEINIPISYVAINDNLHDSLYNISSEKDIINLMTKGKWNLMGTPINITKTELKNNGASSVWPFDPTINNYTTDNNIKAGSGFWIK